jgi:hypothetical protein
MKKKIIKLIRDICIMLGCFAIIVSLYMIFPAKGSDPLTLMDIRDDWWILLLSFLLLIIWHLISYKKDK